MTEQDTALRVTLLHASPQECVDMAARAEVGHVVLTHHLPEGNTAVDASSYAGRVTVGADLDRFTAGR